MDTLEEKMIALGINKLSFYPSKEENSNRQCAMDSTTGIFFITKEDLDEKKPMYAYLADELDDIVYWISNTVPKKATFTVTV
jgi:hypothetical protein